MRNEMLQSDAKPTEEWRRYAALEIVRQAVIDLRQWGDISGVTTEKMKALFQDLS